MFKKGKKGKGNEKEKEDIPKLPKPVLHTGGLAHKLDEVLLGTACFYCGYVIPHNIKRVTCRECKMNYCWKCIEYVWKYHDAMCLRCGEFDNYSNSYDKVPLSSSSS